MRSLWTYPIAEGARAQAYADDDIAVFTSQSNAVIAVDARSGALRWRRDLALPPRLQARGMPFANVAAFENLLIVPAWDLHALDRETGQVLWTFSPPEDVPAATSVRISGTAVISGGGRSLYSVDARTGAPIWRTDLGERPFHPIVVDGVIYVGTRGFVNENLVLGAGHALALDAARGEVLWSFPLPDAPAPEPWVGGATTEGVVSGDLYLIATASARVYAIERATGELRWEHGGGGPFDADLVVVDGVVIAGSLSGHVVGLDLQNGSVLWTWRLATSIFSASPGPASALINNFTLRAIDAQGRGLWRHFPEPTGENGYNTRPTFHNGSVYIGSLSGFHALSVPDAGRTIR